MQNNPVRKLREFGQSLWLDYLSRGMLDSAGLKKLIDEDGLCGVTSNPAIFQKALSRSADYDDAVKKLAQEGKSAEEAYRILTVEDVRRAADAFRPVYDANDGCDGFVSLEVSPHLARNVEGTLKEARELWNALDRPNVFIKVPGTKEGLTCIRRLIADGININVTLLFGLERYREVAEAYFLGLQDRINAGKPVERIASVASFFLSRIDVLIDPKLKELAAEGGEKGKRAEELRGEAAIASARIAYQIYKEVTGSQPFLKLKEQGAKPQRVLWASTSTKNPEYSDVKYVEALIGPDTINTVPQETLEAYRDHGDPAMRLENDLDKARRVLDELEKLGIHMKDVSQQLEDEGIEKFNKPFDQSLEALAKELAKFS
ncbi:MAG: transaldolase [Candidatus Eisenbacteria bacterium]|nr:transaldolase [Candidatus Eisenbacteria bacterium]